MPYFIKSCLLSVFSLLLLVTNTAAVAAPKTDAVKIAIANYGPHHSLNATIAGFRAKMAQAGYIDGKNITYDIVDVNFDQTLIRQMLVRLKANNPTVIVTLSTPVSQAAKHLLVHIPLVFSCVADPLQAGLLAKPNAGQDNITGASDRDDVPDFLTFAHTILPNARRVGMLYAPSQANDVSLLHRMQAAVKARNMHLVALPIDNMQEIPIRTRQFQNQVDFIYVGMSGPVQPGLPAIVSVADKLKIPVFNADKAATLAGEVLGSFAVSYKQVGANTAQLVLHILQGKKPANLAPIYPKFSDYHAFISIKKAKQLGIVLPKDLKGVTLVP